MNVDYRYEHVSGTTADRLYTVGVRFDSDYVHHSTQECWVIEMERETIHISNGHPSTYTGVWASASGEVFVADGNGAVFRRAGHHPSAGPWAMDSVEPTLTGIWGVDPSYVLAWGGPAEALLRWDGTAWHSMPHPGGYIRAIHGVSRDFIMAVGHEGLIARWNGRDWTRVPYPALRLSSVVVVSADQIFAAGPAGELLEGSEHGMAKLLQADSPILSLAWFQGALWVGTEDGLCKLVGGALEMVKDMIVATEMDARGDLLICEDNRIVTSSDGQRFTAYPVKTFASYCAGNGTLWAPTEPVDRDTGFEP